MSKVKLNIEEIPADGHAEVIIRCHQLTPQLKQIIELLEAGTSTLVAYDGDEIYKLHPTDIFYIESLERKTFLYGKNKVYESRAKLYELEEALAAFNYFRASKSLLVNLEKVQSFNRAASRKFEAVLQNGEKVLISRHFVSNLKTLLKNPK